MRLLRALLVAALALAAPACIQYVPAPVPPTPIPVPLPFPPPPPPIPVPVPQPSPISWEALSSVHEGDAKDGVYAALGPPYKEATVEGDFVASWRAKSAAGDPRYVHIHFVDGKVTKINIR